MKEEGIIFVKQLLEKLEGNVKELEEKREDNEPREFNELKKKSFDIHKKIEELL